MKQPHPQSVGCLQQPQSCAQCSKHADASSRQQDWGCRQLSCSALCALQQQCLGPETNARGSGLVPDRHCCHLRLPRPLTVACDMRQMATSLRQSHRSMQGGTSRTVPELGIKVEGLGELDTPALGVSEALEVQDQRAGQTVQAQSLAGAPGHRAIVQLVLCASGQAQALGGGMCRGRC